MTDFAPETSATAKPVAGRGGLANWLPPLRRTVARGLAFGLLAGIACATTAADKAKSGNFFQASDKLADDVQRVLILPLASDKRQADLVAGCESLEPVLQAELAKTRKFEIVVASAETLRSCTGRALWSAEDALPLKFFESLREAYGCDAVLFCQLTAYKAYAPLSVGWRLRLVDARSRQTVWASDEVFDAADKSVQEGVRRFEKLPKVTWFNPQSSDWLARHSPRRFGQFTLATVLATLPDR
jgi:hypothetical protein